MLMRSFSITNGKLFMGLSSGAGDFANTVSSVREQPRVTPALCIDFPLLKKPTKYVFEGPMRQGLWSVAEDRRLVNGTSGISGPSTKAWSKALNPSTPKTGERKVQKNKACSWAGSSMNDAIDLMDDDNNVLYPEEQTDFSKETAALSSFADSFLPNVQSSTTSTLSKKRKLASRKRKIDFSGKGQCDLYVADVLDAIERPAKRFTMRTVEKVRPIEASSVYMKLPLTLCSDTIESKLKSINYLMNKKPKM